MSIDVKLNGRLINKIRRYFGHILSWFDTISSMIAFSSSVSMMGKWVL